MINFISHFDGFLICNVFYGLEHLLQWQDCELIHVSRFPWNQMTVSKTYLSSSRLF